MDFETLYSHVCGEFTDNIASLNIYTTGGKCDLLYKRLYNLREEINKRLNTDEDEQLFEFESILWEIAKESARRVYNFCNEK